MRSEKVILLLEVVTIILCILFSVTIGYAVEKENFIKTDENPFAMQNKRVFNVKFVGKPTFTGVGSAKVNITGDTTATIDIKDLKKAGDQVKVIFTIQNSSNNIDANISIIVNNTNTEYFSVTAKAVESNIKAKNGKTNVELLVELIKVPIEKEEKSNISIDIIAEPVY